jgi:hypothetical protein
MGLGLHGTVNYLRFCHAEDVISMCLGSYLADVCLEATTDEETYGKAVPITGVKIREFVTGHCDSNMDGLSRCRGGTKDGEHCLLRCVS